ncbi:MAG TPA: hypothetical protein VIM79_18725 [Niastella sp.]
MNVLVKDLSIRIHIDDFNMNYGKPAEKKENPVFSVLSQAFNKETAEKLRMDEIQKHYSLILHELKQLDFIMRK